MKIKILMILLSFCLIFSACKKSENESNIASNNETKIEQNTGKSKKAMLFTNMTVGSESPDIKQFEWEYTGDLNVEKLAQGLTELTGLNFNITSKTVTNGLIIDWNNDSTLIANLGDKEQKEEFHFFDADSMRWFMLDSLWLTITNNLDIKEVYYSMNDGENLIFDELFPVNGLIPNDLAYTGSAFFFAHANVKSDDMDGRGDIIDESDENDGRGDLIEESDNTLVGFWNSSNNIEEGFSTRYAFYSDDTFIYAASELGEFERELFKTGKWSIIDEEQGILELVVEVKWAVPVGDIDTIVPSDELIVLKEVGLVKIINKEPEIEVHKIIKADTDAESGRATIKIDDIVFYDFSENNKLFKLFYDLPTE